jgi:DNA-binding CsgD family transcriptional regulator
LKPIPLAGAKTATPRDPATGAALKRCVAAADLLVGRSEFSFFMFDAFEGRRLYSNAAFDRLVGYAGRAVVGTLPPYPHWADPTRISAQLKSTLDETFAASGVRAIAARYRHQSGREFDVMITGIEVRRGQRAIAYLAMPVEIDGLSHERALRVLAISETLRALDQAMEAIGRASIALQGHSGWKPWAVPLLTAREQEIAGIIGGGLRVKSVARMLAVSEFTVRNHLKSIYRKLGVRSQAELLERIHAAGHNGADV